MRTKWNGYSGDDDSIKRDPLSAEGDSTSVNEEKCTEDKVENLLYAIVSSSVVSLLVQLYRHKDSYDLSGVVGYLLSIGIGAYCGLRLGYRCFVGREFRFSFHIAAHCLLVVLVIAVPVIIYVLVYRIFNR